MSKELKYVECPNCGEVFDDTGKFFYTGSFWGWHKFTCNECDYVFKYPTSRHYFALSLLWWLIMTVLQSIMMLGEEVAFVVILPYLVLCVISFRDFWGGLINHFSLKKNVPWDYTVRLFNTIQKK